MTKKYIGTYEGFKVYKREDGKKVYVDRFGYESDCLSLNLMVKIAKAIESDERETARKKHREIARREKELNKRERMKGANVGYTLADLADLADLFDVDDTVDICNHYATAYAF